MTVLRRTKARGESIAVEATPVSSAEEVRETIARRAYQLYEMRGAAEGDPLTDWLMAEAEILTSIELRTNHTTNGNGKADTSSRRSAPTKSRKKSVTAVTRKITPRSHSLKDDHR
jgi:hypothetical protein